jgi:16S rRNA (uracil1498-N3)-methyltransferase
MPRFHAACPLHPGQTLSLPDDTARHVQVLRLQPGDELELFNGLGGSFTARVLQMGRQIVEVQVLSHQHAERESACHTHIVIGMPANERMDWLVEKATELGVAHITPVMTQHTVLRLSGERGLKRQQHWQGIAQAACAQSGRNRVPQIDAPQPLNDWLKALPAALDPVRVLLSLQPNARAWRDMWMQHPPDTLMLLSGPEGGLSAEEETLALSLGFQAAHLGNRVLRAETAPLAVLAQLL